VEDALVDESRLTAQVSDAAPQDDLELIDCLRQGDEGAFIDLVARYNPTLGRVARMYVASPPLSRKKWRKTRGWARSTASPISSHAPH
jgi:hypothetical protein